MIHGKDISVVISGPVLHEKLESGFSEVTKLACESVRTLLPEAELIVSTWEGSDVSNLTYDIVVFNKDPGANINNVNRQICSRRRGIEKATREYVLAIRSESRLVNLNFLDYIDKYEEHNKDISFLNHRVIIPASVPTRNGEIFHMGDWYYFGHKEDVLKVWSIPYLNDNEVNQKKDDILINAHRHLIISFVKQNMNFDLTKKKQLKQKYYKDLYEKVIVGNFVIIGLHQFGCRSMKYVLKDNFSEILYHNYVSYSFSDWKHMYKRLASGSRKTRKLVGGRYSIVELFAIIIYCPIRKFVYEPYCRLKNQLNRKKNGC